MQHVNFSSGITQMSRFCPAIVYTLTNPKVSGIRLTVTITFQVIDPRSDFTYNSLLVLQRMAEAGVHLRARQCEATL